VRQYAQANPATATGSSAGSGSLAQTESGAAEEAGATERVVNLQLLERNLLESKLMDAASGTHRGDAAGLTIDPGIPLDELVVRVKRDYQQRFGRAPQWLAAAPGRVNLIGEHTDYNEGFVLPMAIERYVVVAAAEVTGAAGEAEVGLHSCLLNQSERCQVGASDFRKLAPWARYVYGVMVGCGEQGLAPPALEVLIDSTVPLGGGLSSSAALEVATATLLEAVTGKSLDPIRKALLCQKAEHHYAGMPCGIMDQFTSVLGQASHLLLLDCRSTEVQLVPLADPDVEVLIINTNVKHELTGSEYPLRRSQCETAARTMGVRSLRDASPALLAEFSASLDPVLQCRARHVIGEIERTEMAAQCLAAGQWARLGELMYASHASLRDDYEVSCQELDLLVELAQKHGAGGKVIGSRMTGGGFGGCTVSLVRKNHLEAVAAAIGTDYRQQTGIAPSLFTTRPAQGAQIVRG